MDRLVPGRARRNLALSIDGVASVARDGAGADGMDSPNHRLWTLLCDASRQTLHQLLVKNDDKRLDWGLKKRAARIDDTALVVMFWWMLLYQLVVFRNKGLDGYSPEESTDPMYEAATRFVETEFVRLGIEIPPPLWAEDWRRHYPLESAMAFYNCAYDLLHLDNDLTKRIAHVSHFATLTERGFERLAAESSP